MDDSWEYLRIEVGWDDDSKAETVSACDNPAAVEEITARMPGPGEPDLLDFCMQAHSLGWRMSSYRKDTLVMKRAVLPGGTGERQTPL